ncbi:hypothetical protein C1646_745782 [Rhizophagus diaphanus]|nr:hypothetical protein C1646_745782 [Rhizophagus diaphanus] [Rhizophagus sp. MUCL 43196]
MSLESGYTTIIVTKQYSGMDIFLAIIISHMGFEKLGDDNVKDAEFTELEKCPQCDKDILTPSFEAFIVLACGHLLRQMQQIKNAKKSYWSLLNVKDPHIPKIEVVKYAEEYGNNKAVEHFDIHRSMATQSGKNGFHSPVGSDVASDNGSNDNSIHDSDDSEDVSDRMRQLTV